jgi:hypothetical protein
VVRYIKIDLDIPITLSRSIIQRYLWKELNQYHGSSYLFKVDEDSTLAVEKEQIAKLDTLIRQKLNVNTRQAEYILVLQQDPENDKMEIEIWDWELEEAQLEQYQSLKAKSAGSAQIENEEEDDFNNPDKFKNVNEQTLRQKAELAIYFEELKKEAQEKEAEKQFKEESSAKSNL